jgi:hypothetical protein
VREKHGRGTQGKSKVPFAQFVWGLLVHALSARGTLGHHVRTMSAVDISDEAAMQRRQGLRWEWFEALFAQVLLPLARRGQHEESFYQGHRLLGLDGTEWSLRNTEAVTSQRRARHRNAQREAAFYKWGTAVLLELGTHQPLGVARALPELEHAEGEMNIARRALGGIPKQEDTLLLADRLYGCGRFICDVQEAAGARAQVLVRVSRARQATVVRALADGSALVDTRVCDAQTKRPSRVLRVREIRGVVWRQGPHGQQPEAQGAAPVRAEVRLWTTLLDEQKHPAKELLELYAQRWEQELFFHELKRHTGRHSLLRAASLQGAEAELGALIMAANLLAQQRLKAAKSVGLQPVRLSVGKIAHALQALLPVLNVAGELLSTKLREDIINKFLAHMARESVIKPRRKRSCQRGLRKPQSSWPRIDTRCDLHGTFAFELTAL